MDILLSILLFPLLFGVFIGYHFLKEKIKGKFPVFYKLLKYSVMLSMFILLMVLSIQVKLFKMVYTGLQEMTLLDASIPFSAFLMFGIFYFILRKREEKQK